MGRLRNQSALRKFAIAFALASSASLFAQAPSADVAYDLTTPTGVIYGTLRLPVETQFYLRSAAQYPVVLIIAGSGPTDRNGNGGPQLQSNT